MDITKLSVTELKALAYDELVKKQLAEQNLQAINQQISILSSEADKKSTKK